MRANFGIATPVRQPGRVTPDGRRGAVLSGEPEGRKGRLGRDCSPHAPSDMRGQQSGFRFAHPGYNEPLAEAGHLEALRDLVPRPRSSPGSVGSTVANFGFKAALES